MVITLEPELEAALNEAVLARGLLRSGWHSMRCDSVTLRPDLPVVPRDEWKRQSTRSARECGVSLPDSSVSREALYE